MNNDYTLVRNKNFFRYMTLKKIKASTWLKDSVTFKSDDRITLIDFACERDLSGFERTLMSYRALQIPCRVLHVLLHYFLLTNYAWMLCEGFYLHTLLVSAFTSEHKLVNWLMGLGWPVPAVIVTLYTILRACSSNPEDTEQ